MNTCYFSKGLRRVILYVGCFSPVLLTGCNKAEQQHAQAALVVEECSDYTWSGIGFGIEMSMELHSVTEKQGDAIGAQTEQVIQQLEQSFSLYLENSDLQILNRERVLVNPSAQFLSLLGSAKSLNTRTKGYSQPAIHGAWSSLDSRIRKPMHWIEQCSAANLNNVSISAKEVKFTHPLTQLSFNAIVQGYLADGVKDIVLKAGVESALLHLGETYVIGSHPEGRSWELAVMGTAVDGEIDLVGTMALNNAGLAVSAHDSSRQLLNPTNWNVEQSDRVVAVVSEEGAMVADAFATAFAVAPKSAWPTLHAELNKGGKCQVKIWVENQLSFKRVSE